MIGDPNRRIQRTDYMHATAGISSTQAGNPSQLLANRPDIRQSEQELAAAALDVQAARANFYPAIRLEKFVGTQSFNPKYLFDPASFIFSLAADLAAPLVNRNNIHAIYNSADARQTQALLWYGQRTLNAYLEVTSELSNAANLSKSFETKSREVAILFASIGISNDLFQSAQADYIEVLLTQEEALHSKLELIEIQLNQWKNKVQLYRSLGMAGSWGTKRLRIG